MVGFVDFDRPTSYFARYFTDLNGLLPSRWALLVLRSSWSEGRVGPLVAARGKDSDALVVCCLTGRLFTCDKDAPPLHLAAASVAGWLERYAKRIEAGDYTVEEGFGDYSLQG